MFMGPQESFYPKEDLDPFSHSKAA